MRHSKQTTRTLAVTGTFISYFVAVFVVATLAVTADAQPTTFNDPTVTERDGFGDSVALDGNKVLIGAQGDDTKGTRVGQAHLFDATTGNLLWTFDDPTVTDLDGFGRSVALDGNNVLIGAPGDDTRGDGVGQAHLFDVTTGSLLQTFDDPTVTDLDVFGWWVALDGNNVLIGAVRDSTQGAGVGQAHLFDALSGNLLQTFIDPTPTPGSTIFRGDAFGASVALDGNRVLIGAPDDDTNGTNVGQAHLFDATTGNLLWTFDDPTVTTEDSFGSKIALDGNYILIGASSDDTNGNNVGQAHLFDGNPQSPTFGDLLRTFEDPTVTDQDVFGASVALDGNNVLIGAALDDTNGANVGQAHLFDAVTGSLLRTFNDPTVTDGDSFGVSVALDGNNVLIGASEDDTHGNDVGQAHLFTLPSLLGDFDFDRDADGFDFLKWQRGESPNSLSQSDLADWEADYGNTISLTEPGDFDKDLDVDGFDFLEWQRDPSVGSLADWEANYGTVATLSATSAIPEPTTCTLALAALCLVMGRRRVS